MGPCPPTHVQGSRPGHTPQTGVRSLTWNHARTDTARLVSGHNAHPVPGLVSTSAANCDYLPGFGGTFFSSALMLKDLRLSQDAARDFGAYTPLCSMAAELYDDFVRDGNAELDFGAIIKTLESKERSR